MSNPRESLVKFRRDYTKEETVMSLPSLIASCSSASEPIQEKKELGRWGVEISQHIHNSFL
jgi:hypothetical protein